MTRFIQDNLVSIIIAIASVVSTYTLYGYRISDLEKQSQTQQAAIASIQTQQSSQAITTQVALAQIQTELTYIKASVDRLTK